MSKKLHAFINAALAEENLASPGHLIIRSDVLQRVDELFHVLSKILIAEKKKQIFYDEVSQGDGDELVPTPQLALYRNLTKRSSNVSSLHCYSPNTPELHKFSLLIFPNLIELKLDMCPLSTIGGLYKMKHQIQLLEVMNSGICDLADALIPYISDVSIISSLKPSLSIGEAAAFYAKSQRSAPKFSKFRSDHQYNNIYEWNKLSTLKLINCGLSRLDESLHMFPSLTSLDISRNAISYIVHLQDCYALRHLNISRNRIKTISHVGRVLVNITVLNLSHNLIETIEGIDKLIYLEKIDLSGNLLEDFSEIRYLNRLSSLDSIVLIENPLTKHPQYRLMVYNEFASEGSLISSKSNLPQLDGLALTSREYKSLRGVLFRSLGCDYQQLQDNGEETDSLDTGSLSETMSSVDGAASLSSPSLLLSPTKLSSSKVSSPNYLPAASNASPGSPLKNSPTPPQIDYRHSFSPKGSSSKDQTLSTLSPFQSEYSSPNVYNSPQRWNTETSLITNGNGSLSPSYSPAISPGFSGSDHIPSNASLSSSSPTTSVNSGTSNENAGSSRAMPTVSPLAAKAIKKATISGRSIKTKEVSDLVLPSNNSRCNPNLLATWKQKRSKRKLPARVVQIQTIDKESITYPSLEEVKKFIIATRSSMVSALPNNAPEVSIEKVINDRGFLTIPTSVIDDSTTHFAISTSSASLDLSLSSRKIDNSQQFSSMTISGHESALEFDVAVSQVTENMNAVLKTIVQESINTSNLNKISAPGLRASQFEDPTINLPIDIRMSISSKNKVAHPAGQVEDVNNFASTSAINISSNSANFTSIINNHFHEFNDISRELVSINSSNGFASSFCKDDPLIGDVKKDRMGSSPSTSKNDEELSSSEGADLSPHHKRNETSELSSFRGSVGNFIPDFDDADIEGLNDESEITEFAVPAAVLPVGSLLSTERSTFGVMGLSRFGLGSNTGGNLSSMNSSIIGGVLSAPVNIAETSNISSSHSNRSSFTSEMSIRIKVHNPTSAAGRIRTDSHEKVSISEAPKAFDQGGDHDEISSNCSTPPSSFKAEIKLLSCQTTGNVPFCSKEQSKDHENKFLDKKNFYIGDSEYLNLSVLENLELYFTEQVFQPSRRTHESCYIRLRPQCKVQQGSRIYANSYAGDQNDESIQDNDVIFIDPPMKSERCLFVFHEHCIEVTPDSVLAQCSWTRLQTKVRDVESLNNFSCPSNETFVGSIRQHGKERKNSRDGASSSFQSSIVNEAKVVFVLTDLKFYIVEFEKLDHSVTFRDAPLPILLRSHDIFSLMKCTIFFGFQRSILSFANVSGTYCEESLLHRISNINDGDDSNLSYAILTRDKSKTYSIITKVPKTANASRTTMNKFLGNVKIMNKDGELLDSLIRNVNSLGLDPDIVQYQMLFQTWIERPGYAEPRSLILASKMILLCDENLNSFTVDLKIIDSSHVRDIWKVQNEDDPLILLLIFKSQTLFGSRRKWRLRASSRQAVIKFQEDCRRVCMENGNNDV